MKKIYMTPTTILVKIKTDCVILAGSPTPSVSDEEYNTTEFGEVESRGDGFWEDD